MAVAGCPDKFHFANEFGILRRDDVFSSIDVRKIIQSEDCGCAVQFARLSICDNVTKSCQKGITTTLIDTETDSQFSLPAGTIITEITVVDRTCGNLSCDLAFMLGFLSPCIEDETRLALMAQRVAPASAQITGSLLNHGSRLKLVEGVQLTAATLAAQNAIYFAEDAENGACLQDIDFGIIFGNNALGEPKDLLPAITLTSGELCVGDIDFFVCYIPPCPGIICRPALVCEPCEPRRCGKQCGSECDIYNRAACFGSNGKRGCH